MSEIATNVTTKLDTVDEIIKDLSLKSSGSFTSNDNWI